MSKKNRATYYLGKIGESVNALKQTYEVRRFDGEGNLIETIENPGSYWDRKKPKYKWRKRFKGE